MCTEPRRVGSPRVPEQWPGTLFPSCLRFSTTTARVWYPPRLADATSSRMRATAPAPPELVAAATMIDFIATTQRSTGGYATPEARGRYRRRTTGYPATSTTPLSSILGQASWYATLSRG